MATYRRLFADPVSFLEIGTNTLKCRIASGGGIPVSFGTFGLSANASWIPERSATPLDRYWLVDETLCQLFGQLYKQAGVDGASSHSGRRSFISKLAHNGVSPKVIMTLAGHKHLTTTQRYIDVSDEMLRQAVNLV